MRVQVAFCLDGFAFRRNEMTSKHMCRVRVNIYNINRVRARI